MSDTTLNINPDEITGVLRRHLEGFRPEVEKQQVGRIIEVGDNFITLEIADNVRIKVQRFQVTTLVPKGTLKGA